MKREMRNSGWLQLQCRIVAYLDGLQTVPLKFHSRMSPEGEDHEEDF
jgi:hypothetical protein